MTAAQNYGNRVAESNSLPARRVKGHNVRADNAAIGRPPGSSDVIVTYIVTLR